MYTVSHNCVRTLLKDVIVINSSEFELPQLLAATFASKWPLIRPIYTAVWSYHYLAAWQVRVHNLVEPHAIEHYLEFVKFSGCLTGDVNTNCEQFILRS